jgi:hypothetical protein
LVFPIIFEKPKKCRVTANTFHNCQNYRSEMGRAGKAPQDNRALRTPFSPSFRPPSKQNGVACDQVPNTYNLARETLEPATISAISDVQMSASQHSGVPARANTNPFRQRQAMSDPHGYLVLHRYEQRFARAVYGHFFG